MCSAHSLSMSSLLLTWLCFVTSVFVRGSDREYEDFERCSAPRSEPCGASGHMTMKGWQLTGKPVEEVCSTPPEHCKRPCGVFFHFFKLAAGLVMGQGTLGPMFPATNLSWVETYSLAHEPTMIKLKEARSRRWPTITVLRHPMERLIGQFFATAESTDEYDSFRFWMEKHSKPPPRRGNDGSTKLWIELDNAYVKVFSGFNGRRAATIVAQSRKARGEPPLNRDEMARLAARIPDPEAALRTAKKTVSELYDFPLIAEWLDSPQSIALLGDAWCFSHTRGVVHVRPALPSFKRLRRARNADRRKKLDHEAKRKEMRNNATWWNAAGPSLQELADRNALDLELYKFVAERQRARLAAHWRQRYGEGTSQQGDDAPPALPELPCATSTSRCSERGVIY